MVISSKIFKGCIVQNRRAQEKLYKAIYPDLMRILLRYTYNTSDAELVLNKAMFKVFTNIADFKGTYLNFGGWIKRILINEALDAIRSEKAFKKTHLIVEFFPDNEVSANIDDHPECILALLQELPPLTARVFDLFVIEGFSHKEISKLLDISEGNSRWNLHSARGKLQQSIIEKEWI